MTAATAAPPAAAPLPPGGRRRLHVHERGGHRDVRLPAGPLVAAVAESGAMERLLPPVSQWGRRERSLSRAFYRVRADGAVTPYLADRLAVELLGVHPADVYGDAWRKAWSRP